MMPENYPILAEGAKIYLSRVSVYTIGWGVLHLIGFICSIHALLSVRTPQGTIAWIATLNTVPIIAVPAYLVFGRSKFKGFIFARQAEDSELKKIVEAARPKVAPFLHQVEESPDGTRGRFLAVERLAKMPFLKGYEVELLIDGHATFDSIFAGIDDARDYILIQFYIVHDDDIGRELKDHLSKNSREGIRVFFLYDEIGCGKLPEAYARELREAGVHMQPFRTTRGSGNRFQLNFRNHRKIVVVDGRVGWIGGHNVGDEYLGRDKKFKGWRDTT